MEWTAFRLVAQQNIMAKTARDGIRGKSAACMGGTKLGLDSIARRRLMLCL